MIGKIEGKRWFFGVWGSAFVGSDIPNYYDGGCLYCWAKVRPRWFWFLCRLWLFVRIVWRPVTSQGDKTYYLDWRTAWAVSKCAVGLSVLDGRTHEEMPTPTPPTLAEIQDLRIDFGDGRSEELVRGIRDDPDEEQTT